MIKNFSVITFLLILFAACNNNINKENNSQNEEDSSFARGSYGYDAAFLKKYTGRVLELKNSDGAKVLLSADYQGRVMTSTASGDSSNSFDWLNYDFINEQKMKMQFKLQLLLPNPQRLPIIPALLSI